VPNTLADLMQVTDATRRKIQFWVEAGAIVPEPGTDRGGKGVHREFSTEELVIACVLKAIEGDHVVPIGRLLAISRNLRSELMLSKHIRNEFNEAMAGRLDLFMILSPGNHRQSKTASNFVAFFLVPNSRTTIIPRPDYDLGRLLRKILAEDLIADSSRDNCSRIVVYLNPWLSRVRETLK
jgi:hypothetical protein